MCQSWFCFFEEGFVFQGPGTCHGMCQWGLQLCACDAMSSDVVLGPASLAGAPLQCWSWVKGWKDDLLGVAGVEQSELNFE